MNASLSTFSRVVFPGCASRWRALSKTQARLKWTLGYLLSWWNFKILLALPRRLCTNLTTFIFTTLSRQVTRTIATSRPYTLPHTMCEQPQAHPSIHLYETPFSLSPCFYTPSELTCRHAANRLATILFRLRKFLNTLCVTSMDHFLVSSSAVGWSEEAKL